MTKQSEFAVLLGLNPLFSGLGADSINRIAALCHTQYLAAGEILFRKGDSGDALFGIRRGQIRIESGSPDGGRLTLNFLGAGDLCGEIAVLDGQTRTADATAGEPSELFVLRRNDFLNLLESEPRVAGETHRAALPADQVGQRPLRRIRLVAPPSSAGATTL